MKQLQKMPHKVQQIQKNRVIQQGQDGLKEVTYKTKYQNDEQIEKIVLSEEIIKEPIDRIVQVQKKYCNNIKSRI